jgi:hypothetical protein
MVNRATWSYPACGYEESLDCGFAQNPVTMRQALNLLISIRVLLVLGILDFKLKENGNCHVNCTGFIGIQFSFYLFHCRSLSPWTQICSLLQARLVSPTITTLPHCRHSNADNRMPVMPHNLNASST